MRHFFAQLVPQSIKNLLWHFPQAVLAAWWYCFPARNASRSDSGRPARELKMIGVTGTNGKTTATTLIGRMLEAAGKKVAIASTIAVRMNGVERVNATKFTTASPWSVQKFLREAVKNGCEYVVLEVSSHALDQYRVWGIHFEVAVITNVTREHLDYHQTIEAYRRAKRRLFDRAEKAVVNLDMERPEEYLAGNFRETLTYSTKNREAGIFADNIELDFKGTRFIALGQSFRTQLPGLFNVENALAAIATGQLLGLEPSGMARSLAEVRGIPGRMELVPNDRQLDIVIDYAVTPDAFEKLYGVVTPLKIPGTKIIHVFGACGERDRGKRPLMGGIASQYADVVILTNEDPYYEDPERILDDIEAGVNKTKLGKHFCRIFDRREAIRKALTLAEAGDIILVTGKGAEETMAMGAKRQPWRERAVILEELTGRSL